jgi:predicted nucleic acid-binding protein
VSNERARAVLSAGEPLVTTDHVLVETWTLLRWRIHREAAEAFWEGLRSVAFLEAVGEADLEVAWRIGRDFSDQDFSLVDRTSFAVMVRTGIERVASFDPDFAVFRYGPRRARAFEVVR